MVYPTGVIVFTKLLQGVSQYFILYTTETNALRKKETNKGLLQTEVKLIQQIGMVVQ